MSKNTQVANLVRPTAFIIGALIITVFVFAAAGEFDIIDASVAKRAVGMIFGALLMVTGNLMPKIVRPLSTQYHDSARVMAVERFSGWAFVLAGIAYIAVWMLAPQKYTMLISSVVGLGAFVPVAAAWTWLARRVKLNNQLEKETFMSDPSSITRVLIFAIFHALIWVFAMFLADSIWGDAISRAMLIPFTIANTLFAIFLLRTIRRARSRSGE